LTIIYGTVVVWILCMFAEGFWPRLWVSAAATTAMAFGTTVWNTVTVSLRQRIVPATLFGRVNSVYRWLVWGSISIGSALGGLVAHEFGLRAPFFFGAAMGGIALIVLFLSITRASLAEVAEIAGPLSLDDASTSVEAHPWW
jgi:predicted MFS family arabinose efflux permease